jgi:uncharacterized membrane protein affecting hemolysin expression
MTLRTWWMILIAVLMGAILAGSFLAVHYTKQQVPPESIDESGLR